MCTAELGPYVKMYACTNADEQHAPYYVCRDCAKRYTYTDDDKYSFDEKYIKKHNIKSFRVKKDVPNDTTLFTLQYKDVKGGVPF